MFVPCGAFGLGLEGLLQRKERLLTFLDLSHQKTFDVIQHCLAHGQK
jgi:hypothetical protein